MSLITLLPILQTLWVIFIVVMLFWKFRIGVAAYLAYIFLIPYMKISLGGLTLQWNLINIILLLAFFYHRQEYDDDFNYDWRPLLPFFLYFGISLILMPFQEGVPFNEAISVWRVQSMKFLILPFVIWNDIRTSYDSLRLYRNVTIGCIIIASLYGLYLTTMPGINPYMMLISAANGEEFNLAYAAGNSGLSDDTTLNDDRIFGRISSVFNHPMTFGLFLGFSLFYLYRNKEIISQWLLYSLSILILTDIIVCGVRSVIGAAFVAILVLLFQSRNFKLLCMAAITGLFILTLIIYVPALNNYLGSLIDFSSSDIQGSSLDMRISQFEGCFEEIQSTLIEGKGYCWTNYYTIHFGGHPTMLFFESLLIFILCNSGIIGVAVWLAMSIIIYKYNNWSEKSVASILNALFAFYLAYALFTGEYGYMMYFIIFYMLMLGEDLYTGDESEQEINEYSTVEE